MNLKVLFSYVLIFTIFQASAQEITDFSLIDSRSGENVSLSDFGDSKGVAVIFTSNICPYSVYYEGRITQLVADYSSRGIQFVLINSHLEDKESSEEMANKISIWGINVPYLADKDQKVLKMFNSRKSPEVFLLKKNGNSFSVFYKGAIDNNPQVATDVKDQYLKQNIEMLLSGKSSKPGGRPIGCMIKRG